MAHALKILECTSSWGLGPVINIHDAISLQGQHVADDGFGMCGKGERMM